MTVLKYIIFFLPYQSTEAVTW